MNTEEVKVTESIVVEEVFVDGKLVEEAVSETFEIETGMRVQKPKSRLSCTTMQNIAGSISGCKDGNSAGCFSMKGKEARRKVAA